MNNDKRMTRCQRFVEAVRSVTAAENGSVQIGEMARRAPLLLELGDLDVTRKYFAEWRHVLRSGAYPPGWGDRGETSLMTLYQEALDALVLLDACYP